MGLWYAHIRIVEYSRALYMCHMCSFVCACMACKLNVCVPHLYTSIWLTKPLKWLSTEHLLFLYSCFFLSFSFFALMPRLWVLSVSFLFLPLFYRFSASSAIYFYFIQCVFIDDSAVSLYILCVKRVIYDRRNAWSIQPARTQHSAQERLTKSYTFLEY